MSDLIIVSTITVCLDYWNFLNQLLKVTSGYAVSDLSFFFTPGRATSLIVSLSVVLKPYLLVFKLCLLWTVVKLCFMSIFMNLVYFTASSRITGSISFHWCTGQQKIICFSWLKLCFCRILLFSNSQLWVTGNQALFELYFLTDITISFWFGIFQYTLNVFKLGKNPHHCHSPVCHLSLSTNTFHF